MSKPTPCPFCGAGLFHHHRPTKHYSWYFGTDYFGTEKFGELEQCPECKGTGVNQWAATVDENVHLKAIVDKLPKTADGVPSIPDLDYVWHWCGTELMRLHHDIYGSAVSDHATAPVRVAISYCYSTRAAAEAAQAGKDAK